MNIVMTAVVSSLLAFSLGPAWAEDGAKTALECEGASCLTPVGSWELTVKFPDGHTERSLIGFQRDGTLIETNESATPIDTRYTGIGTWKRTAKNSFDYGFREQAFSGSVLIGEIHVLQHATLTSAGHFTASGAGTFFDLNRNALGTNNTTSQATRYTLESP